MSNIPPSSIERIVGEYEEISEHVLNEPLQYSMSVLHGKNTAGKDTFYLELHEPEASTDLSELIPADPLGPMKTIGEIHVLARTILIRLFQYSSRKYKTPKVFEGVKVKMTIEQLP
jgi:hypothetical protein